MTFGLWQPISNGGRFYCGRCGLATVEQTGELVNVGGLHLAIRISGALVLYSDRRGRPVRFKSIRNAGMAADRLNRRDRAHEQAEGARI